MLVQPFEHENSVFRPKLVRNAKVMYHSAHFELHSGSTINKIDPGKQNLPTTKTKAPRS